MLGSSIALSISDIPFAGPTGSVVVGYVDGEYVINPDLEQKAKSAMHVYVSGTADAIMMVEAGANEVSEDVMLGGIMYAHEEIKKQVAFINDIVKAVGKPKREMELYHVPADLDAAVREYASTLIDTALEETDRQARQEKQEEVEKNVLEHFAEIYPEMEREIKDSIYYITKEKVRAKILNDGFRPDGRKLTEIRPIWTEVGILPRVHGSAVFTRGQSRRSLPARSAPFPKCRSWKTSTKKCTSVICHTTTSPDTAAAKQSRSVRPEDVKSVTAHLQNALSNRLFRPKTNSPMQ